MKKYNIFYLIGLLVVLSCAKDVVDLTGSIEGIVKDYITSEPLQGVSITLTPTGKSATTGTDGRYCFSELDMGTYSIEYSKEGYDVNKKEVSVLPDQLIRVDAMLNKLANSLIVNPEVINMGDLETTKTFYISCSGHLNNIHYTIKSNTEWISLSKSEGYATSNGDKVTVVVNRSNLSVGNYEKEIIISSTFGDIIIPVFVNQVEKNIATITTNSPEIISETSLTIKGTILKTGGLKITNHGHCWSETKQPTIYDNKNDLGDTESIGDFTSTLTNLVAGKEYYIRAYVINSKGVAYSEQISVKMPYVEKPTVVTLGYTELAKESVVLNGEISSNGNGKIKEYGFYWGTTDKTANKQKVGTFIDSKFAYTITLLESETTYYFKAYAVNEKGESVGEIRTFKSLNKNVADGIPVVVTNNATNITASNATLNGVITDSGNGNIELRGFYFGTNPNPTIRYVANNNSNTFSYIIDNLSEQTTYYYKAFAKNSSGYSYGDVKSFTTGGKPKFVSIEYIGNDTYADLYAKIETGGHNVVEAGFIFGNDYYTNGCTLSNYKDIVKCEIINNTIVCSRSYYKMLTSTSFYCRPYFILEDETVYYYEKVEYMYPGKNIKK